MNNPAEVVVPLAGIVMIITLSLGVPLVRSYSRRLESQAGKALPSGDIVMRLDRIEQAIEAMATEVERVAEGQRFTTKLLSNDTLRVSAVPVAPMSAQSPPAHAEKEPPQGTILSEAARRS